MFLKHFSPLSRRGYTENRQKSADDFKLRYYRNVRSATLCLPPHTRPVCGKCIWSLLHRETGRVERWSTFDAVADFKLPMTNDACWDIVCGHALLISRRIDVADAGRNART